MDPGPMNSDHKLDVVYHQDNILRFRRRGRGDWSYFCRDANNFLKLTPELTTLSHSSYISEDDPNSTFAFEFNATNEFKLRQMKFLTYQPPYFDAKSVRVLDKSYVFFISLDGTYAGNKPTKFMIATKGLAYARFISLGNSTSNFVFGSLKIDKDAVTGEYFMKFQPEKKIIVEQFEPFDAEEFD
jgi:hypothetical protein